MAIPDEDEALSPLNTPPPARHDLVYGRNPANKFLAFLGPLQGTVLDIGPGEGGSAEFLRSAGAARLIAVEPDPIAAQVARSRYDVVVEQSVEEVDPDIIGEADVIVVADCLEHLLDPWEVLRQLHDESRPQTRLAVSVPNLRYLGILGPALLNGRFEYTDAGGIMDRGHLRWFTRASLGNAMTSCGWSPTRWSGAFGTGKRAWLNRMSGRRMADTLSHQIYVVASKGEPE